MNDSPEQFVPILVPAKTAARLCGCGLSLWYELAASSATPECTQLHSKKLWSYDQLRLWAIHDCPSRDSARWQAILVKMRGEEE